LSQAEILNIINADVLSMLKAASYWLKLEEWYSRSLSEEQAGIGEVRQETLSEFSYLLVFSDN